MEKKKKMENDMTEKVKKILEFHSTGNCDMIGSALAGGPDVIDIESATKIADWFDDEANDTWGYDQMHEDIANDIRIAIKESNN